MKTEIRDASGMRRDVRHFTAEAPGAYGWAWSQAVKEYLKNGYKEEGKETEIVAVGKNYKVLDRGEVTAFYDQNGKILFDVENKRLEREYEYFMDNGAGTVPGHEEVGEDNKDAEENAAVDQEEADTEAGEASEEGKTEDEEEAAPPDGAGNSMNLSGKDGGQDSAVEKTGCPEEAEGQSAMQAAKKKLGEELERAKDRAFADPIIAYLLKRCGEDEGLAQDVMQGHKTWEKCLDYIYRQAMGQTKRQTKEECVHVRDEVVYEWAEDYYHKDDKAEETEKVKKEADAKVKGEKAAEKKKATVKSNPAKTAVKPSTDRNKAKDPVKAEKPKEQPKPKKSGKDMEGQLDMFSMMGM